MLYPDRILEQQTGKEYQLLDLSRWDGNRRIKQKFLYLAPDPQLPALLNDERLLERLIRMPNNTRIERINRRMEYVLELAEG